MRISLIAAIPLLTGCAADQPLLDLSHNSRQLIADRGFHSIEISQPAVVVDAIREALREARK